MGVHIADVSYFVLPNSHTDREAQERYDIAVSTLCYRVSLEALPFT